MRKLWLALGPLLIFLLPSMITGGLIGAYPGYKVYEFIWEDARFCTACHIHDYANVAWEASSHGKLTTCHDCHHQPLREYIRETVILMTHKPSFPKDLDHVPYVPNDICQACHISDPEDTSTVSGPMAKEDIRLLPKIDKMHLHKLHLEAKTKIGLLKDFKIADELRHGSKGYLPDIEKGEERNVNCSDCHGGPVNRAHNFSVMDLACLRCHDDTHKGSKIARTYGCRNCHFQEFTLPLKKKILEK